MTIILLIIISLAAFSLGYSLGLNSFIKPKKQAQISHNGMSEKEKREYENFLNYDGTEQV
jgi:hypothetical protein